MTETTGVPIAPEAASMIASRYGWAAGRAAGRRVLEVGCGAGIGLGWIATRGRFTCGVDLSATLLASGRAHYGGRLPFVRASAEALPFAEESFDLVACLEAVYYFPDLARALWEIVRVLKRGGEAIFVSANPERPDFIRSPYSTRYYSADEFRAALEGLECQVTVEAAFPVEYTVPETGRRVPRVPLELARRGLEGLGLVPRTMRGRARLKRLAYGKLRELPPEIGPGFASETSRTGVPIGPVRGFKVLYVLAARRG